MARKYFGDFASRKDIAQSFEQGEGSTWDRNKPFRVDPDFPKASEILFAAYGLEAIYEGSAIVLFERDGQLYEVVGGHCSCYGLEGQCPPEETFWKALEKRTLCAYSYPAETRAAFRRLVDRKLAEAV